MKDKKKIIAILITIFVIALIDTKGTFSWTSLSQRVLNEGAVELTPGGRIHDDFQGFADIQAANLLASPKALSDQNKALTDQNFVVNKDIYAENYSNKPIYVRVKLDEYMEVGFGAGENSKNDKESTDNDNQSEDNDKKIQNQKSDENNTQKKKLAKVIPNAGLDDATLSNKDSWATILPDRKVKNQDEKSGIENYIQLNFGDNIQQNRKVFMPTFNQNNNDLSADVTGEAIDLKTNLKNINFDPALKQLNGLQDQWKIDEQYTGNLKTFDLENNKEVIAQNVTHKAKETLTPKNDQYIKNAYITIDDWKKLPDDEKIGNFWVHDNDGWIYWANPIPPKQATALLLDNFSVNLPQDDTYYAINVTSQFITKDEFINNNNLYAWPGTDNTSTDAQILDKMFFN